MTELADRLARLTPAQRRLLEVRRAQQSAPAPGVIPARGDEPAPLSSPQRRLWFMERMEPGNAFYNLPSAVRVRGALDVPALERALAEIVARHAVLRSVFREVAGEPVQTPLPPCGFILPLDDLPDADDGALRAALAAEARRPFDLAGGPPFRARLFRLGADDHALIVTLHHVVGDASSFGVLFRELGALYGAFAAGQPSPLGPLPIQYADYAAWQRQHGTAEALRPQLDWWTERMTGAPDLLELPADRPRPAVQTFRGGRHHLELPVELTERLRTIGGEHGATLFMVLLAAWQTLLARHTGHDDVVVGSPISGRGRAETEGLIGFFVNTLALRTDLSGDPSFRELVGRARRTALDAYAHQELPFETLVEALRIPRDLSRQPLFQAILMLHRPQGAFALPGLACEPVEADSGTAAFDLGLYAWDRPQGLRAVLEYNADLFDAATAARFAGRFRALLEGIAADPDAPLSRLPVMTADETERLGAWNATGRAFPVGECIHEMIARHAAAAPDAVAVTFEGQRVTYAELDRRAGAIARRLRREGVGPEVRVGILAEPGPELVAGVLGILRAGGAYLPLDPAYPAERLAFMLDDARAPVVLAQPGLLASLPPTGARIVPLEMEDGVDDDEPESGARPENLAYVIYTSGSTGRPKGVLVEHREIANLVHHSAAALGMGPGETTLCLSSVSFDVWVYQALLPLATGGAVRIVAREEAMDPSAVVEALDGVTTLHMVPALMRQVVAAVRARHPAGLPGVRLACAGGDVVSAELRAELGEVFPNAEVRVVYGPTETTVACSSHRVGEGDVGRNLIGGPYANTTFHVVDAAGGPVPVGVPGELWIGGAGVTRGYHARPALTAERYVPDPWSGVPGARLYRSGDRVRWTAEGELEFVGRTDTQVKIRGFRVEPGEIEAAVRACPGVRECTVIAREEGGERRLVAYLAGDADVDALREQLRATLPGHMVPAAIVVLERLPVSPNGKLDRKALPAPEYGGTEERHVAPRTPVEEVLATIYADVLGVERVGAEDSFFELGGHSLLATRVVSRIREVFSVELPLRALFEGPTVAELAGRVEALRRADLPVLPPVATAERTRAVPLSFAQERLWFLDRLEPGSTAYILPLALRLGGDLDVAALERALGEVVRRHEALRTVFAEVDGSPVQVITPFHGFAVPVEDLSALGEADREAAVARRVGGEARRGFDLSAGPLFRAALLRLHAEDHVLLLSMHHIVSDGWSMGVLFNELSALYEAYREGRTSPLPELALQYADYAAWQRRQLEGEVLDRQLAYWRERLADAPALLELPTDHPRPLVPAYEGAKESVVLPGELLARLKALGQREGATVYMTLLAAFQVLLSRYAGSEDVVVGSPIAGRTRGEVEGLIGFFVNTLVLRTDLSGDPGFRETLGRVRAATLGAYEHQELPFERLVAELQPERSLSHSPLFQVMFSVASQAEAAARPLGGLRTEPVTAEAATVKFDLNMVFVEQADGLLALLGYRTDLFERGTIQRMLGHLARVLEQVAGDADVRLSRLELLDGAERDQVLASWNRTARAYPDTPLHELFAEHARRAPDAPALRFRDETLRYGELDRRAGAIARRLRAEGVGPEVRVGILAEPGPDLVAGVLGILRAGGAYLPLDPAYPAERLAFMLDDARAPVVLAQPGLLASLPHTDARIIPLEMDGGVDGSEPESGVLPENLAYVIYTSGSTGRPKGVLVEHRGLSNLVHHSVAALGMGSGDTTLCLASVSFDIWVYQALVPLATGGAVRIVPREQVADVPALVEALDGVTTLHMVPALMRQVAATARDTHPAGLRGVRLACTGGDVVSAELRAELGEVFPEAEVRVFYGPTEATVACSSHRVSGGEAGRNLIGGPFSNAAFYVVDAAGQPVPVGVPGELWIGGAGVTRGYLGRPALTAGTFVPDGFGGAPGARLYRTGDRVRWTAAGELEFLGRTDTQVKIRGFRVEPGEIEAVLRALPGVRECTVVAREDRGERRLIAYLAGDADVDTLREQLRATLPGHMVPAAIVVLERLPVTPNGKLDRKALPAPEYGGTEERHVAPRTAVEEVLAGIYADVLKVERVGAEDSFFELGGHSLLATRVISRLREVFSVELPLRALFEGPTVAELAGRVEALRRADLPVLPPVVATGRAGPLPLSFAQERLWFLDQLGSVGGAYHIPVDLRLRGTLDRHALVGALDRIVARHEALRTTVEPVDGTPLQRISPAEGSRFRLLEDDLSGHPEPEAELRRVMIREAAASFDLARGPLIRGRLLRLADDDHVLLVTMHHIVSDGWSMGVLVGELSALYAAFHRGEPDPLPVPPVQYADYAVWQRRWVAGEVLREQAEFWERTLAGAPELLELPTDRPRPARQDHAGAALRVELDEALTAGLKALGARHGTTLFMTLLAGWAAVLGRLSGHDDVVVGTPSANRGRAEIEGLIGFFVNTLALRVDLSGSPSVAELLARVRAASLAAQQHQDIPFEQVVERVRPVRSLSHNPLFQVLFAWQNTARESLELPGLTVAPAGAGARTTAKFDLSLTLHEAGGRIVGGVEYATALFERATVERYLGYLRAALSAMVADERREVGRLPLLSRAERRQVVEGWNATDAEYPGHACVHSLFEARAERTPGAVAVASDGERVTYAELNAWANRLAHQLLDLGVGPEARVAILMPRSVELVVAELAVLKAGAAYVPIDPSFPAERIAFMVADSGCAVALGRAGADLPVLAGVERVDVDALPEGARHDPRVPLQSGAAAYVMYTSGSTGAPKGVVVPHRAIARLVFNNGYADFRADDRVAFAANPAFDATTMEVWGPLLHGGRAVVIPHDVLLDPDAFARTLADEGITTLFITTAVFNQYARAIPGALSTLRRLLTGGEAADPASFARVLAENGPVSLIHCYGPTETTTFAITHEVTEVEEGARGIPLGRPIANTRVYVLDARGEPVPVGVAGELYVGGAGVALGYQGRPGLTAERFVPDPFAGEPAARMYRTGDLGRWLPDGTIEFLGRNDHQVKVRGFRIELGEIEAPLLAHPEVREAVVLAREDAPGDRRLVAYYVGEAGAETLRAHLSKRLPEYMVPAAYVRLDSLPLTPNGKVDRRALPAPEGSSYATRGYEAPRTPVEEVLAGIYADVLKVERVGAGDDFFALGGHSLLATRVVSRVRAAFDVELPLRALFEDSTVAGLAERIVTLRAESVGTQAPPIVPVPRDGRPLPLSFAQQRLWFVDRLQPGRAAYNVPSRMRVRGVLHLAALERALSEVVRRHESLRTSFPTRDGEPVQQVASPAPVLLPVVDLGALRGEAREAETERLAADEARRPFDLAAGPLLRGTVLRLADDDAVVLLTLHHIVSDGWSMGILVRELSTLYDAFSRGEEAQLPALPVQYADYSVWQREWLAGDVLQAQTGYWRARLAGAPALLELPTDRPRPLVPGDAGAGVAFTIGAETAAALRRLSRREGATLFMTLLAAWQLLLARYSGQDDVVVGSPTAGRNRLETEGLIGFFLNTLVLRADLSGDPEYGELLRRVRESTLGAYQHQDLPFEKLVEELGVERSQAYAPLFQVMFVLQNNEGGRLRLGEAEVESVGVAAGSVKFDLSLSLGEAGEEIRGVLSYRTELWTEASIRRMVEHFARVLDEVAAHPERKLSEVALLGGDERARVLAESGAPGLPYPESLLHELFERQAARTPDAVALVLGEESLSYGELDRRANRLARHLRGRGVGAEVRVAVFLERSFEMVTGVLAILKAGGAYVPLDPSYPAERLAYQVRDSGATLLVTTRALLERLGSTPAEAVLVDAEAEAIARESDAAPPCAATPENLAYVVYTSGSTGRPKGVMVPHRGVVSYLTALVQEYGLAPDDVVLQRSTLSFDASVRDLLGPLTAGARVVLVHTDEAADPVLLMRRIREHRVTAILAIVPSILRPLLDAAEASAAPAPLRLLLVSGEPLAVADCERARRAFGRGARVVNVWGATECTMSSSFHTVGEEDGEGIAPVGVPIPNTRIHVLDARMEPVPPGVAGEAYIAGVGVTRGYRNQPGLTADRFLPDPFGAPGARIYRVGDRVRRRADGTLEFLGRVDQQVKIRGIRVETGEVEAVLRAQAGVRGAVVVAQEPAPGETRLVGYVAGDEEAVTPGALRSSLERTLPAHMIPSVLVRLDELPLLPNGKVDRAALPAPDSGAWRDGQGYVAPSTDTERVLVEIWESLLDARPIGVDDHFFRLGGHSMLAVRLMTQLRGRLGVELPLAALFEHPTVRGLAARVEGEDRPRPWSPLVAIQPRGDRVPIFFVHAVGGEVLSYSDLARELGPEQPFYGLQAGDLAHLGDEEASIEEMAARYVAAIREVRPNGPYLLGGWSFGGFVAFEMAQQLTRAGESVPLVAMLDTRAPGERRPADLDPCLHLAGMARAEALAAGKEISLAADDLRPLDPEARIAHTLEALRAAGVVPGDVEVGWLAAFLRGSEVRMRSALRYQPRSYPGRVAMFVPSDSYAGPEFRALRDDTSSRGWEAYVSEPLLRQTVPGHHNDMLRGGNAATLATHLRALIEESLPTARARSIP